MGLLFCVPASMPVSLVGTAAPRDALATENRMVGFAGGCCPPRPHTRTHTHTHTHTHTNSNATGNKRMLTNSNATEDKRMLANYARARAQQSLFPQHICLGLLFCVPASMHVSLVGNAASRRAFATETTVIIFVVPLRDANTHKRTQTNTHTH